MGHQPWVDDELKALHVCVKARKTDSVTLRKVFPYRTLDSVRYKLKTLRNNDPQKWTPPLPNPPINWQLIEILEAECEESESSQTDTEEVHSV